MSKACLRTFYLYATLPTALSVFVLDVGAPRSGVQSMFEALKKLGLNSLWSGYHQRMRWPWCDYLFGNVTTPPLEALRGWEAAMDEPFHLIYEEVLQTIPDSKFVYTVEDENKWYDNYIEFFTKRPLTTDHLIYQRHSRPVAWQQHALTDGTACWMRNADSHATRCLFKPRAKVVTVPINRQDLHGGRVQSQLDPVLGQPGQYPHDFDSSVEHWECSACHFWGCRFEDSQFSNDPSVRQRCLSGFRQHREEVLRTIPKDRLLIFNLSDGWGPLCEFLGKPVPSEPFPHVDRFYVPIDNASVPGVGLLQYQALAVRSREL